MKKKLFIRAICLLLLCSVLSSLLATSANGYDLSDTLPNTVRAKNVYFANLETSKVLIRKNADNKIAPASTVKIMTGLIATEHFANSKDTQIEITDAMIKNSLGTSMQLKAGDIISAEDLIYATVCGGYNDAAYALACAVAGDSKKFVDMMNEKAAELGAENTKYANPTGWDDAGMYTTLSDTAIIAKAASKNRFYMDVSSTVSRKISFSSGEKEITINNRNALISSHYSQGYTNKYAEGMIAGMTDRGGYCVATLAVINDASYLCIIMGADADKENTYSFSIANALINYARNNLGFVEIMEKGEYICDVPIEFAMKGATDKAGGKANVSAFTGDDVKAYLPLDTDIKDEITHKYYLYSDPLTAPLEAGTRIGGVDFYYQGEVVASAPLIVEEYVEANNFTLGIEKFRQAITGRVAIISAISFVVLFSIWFYFFDYKKRRRKTLEFKYKNQ